MGVNDGYCAKEEYSPGEPGDTGDKAVNKPVDTKLGTIRVEVRQRVFPKRAELSIALSDGRLVISIIYRDSYNNCETFSSFPYDRRLALGDIGVWCDIGV